MIYGKDKIQLQTISQGYEDNLGDWHEGVEAWGIPMLCDAEPANGKANATIYSDGAQRTYSYVVTMPVDTIDIPINTKVLLTCKGKEPQVLHALGFHRYAFQAKLWL